MPNPAPDFASNPGKSITVEAFPGTVTVTVGGAVVAQSGLH